MLFGQDLKATFKLLKEVKKASKRPIFAKLTPNVTKITEIAKACKDAGADGLSLINTVLGMAVDIKRRRPKLSTIIGGLSGPAIRPIGVRAVWEVYQETKLPIIGQGGISTADDALEYIICGARAIAVGTASFVNPKICLEIISGIEKYLQQSEISNIQQVSGSLVVQEER
jgi:dihydroorotate dehydrogenase (NAD+) catalytic subunit